MGETILATQRGLAQSRRGDPMRALHTRRCGRVEDAVVATTDPRHAQSTRQREVYNAITGSARLTRFGGEYYCCTQLAMGFVDRVVGIGLQPYDVQALIPLVAASGLSDSSMSNSSSTNARVRRTCWKSIAGSSRIRIWGTCRQGPGARVPARADQAVRAQMRSPRESGLHLLRPWFWPVSLPGNGFSYPLAERLRACQIPNPPNSMIITKRLYSCSVGMCVAPPGPIGAPPIVAPSNAKPEL